MYGFIHVAVRAELDTSRDQVVSDASRTTNRLAPVARVPTSSRAAAHGIS